MRFFHDSQKIDDPDTDSIAGKPRSKSRRLLLKLMGLGAAMSSGKLFAQTRQLCPEDANWLIQQSLNLQDAVSLIIYRSLDLLHLQLIYINFEKSSANVLTRKTSGTAYLIVNFHPQSLAEGVFLETDASIISGKIPYAPNAYISGKSRSWRSPRMVSCSGPHHLCSP
jgi:hypothetical protein